MSERWTWVPHLWGLFTPAFTLLCLVLGGPWMVAPLLVFLGFYPLLEVVLGQSSTTRPLQEGRAHDIIVHLHVTPEESLRRIRMRSRGCETSITLEYLQGLYEAYEEFIADISRVIPVIKVNWENFQDTREMAQKI